MCFLSKQIDNYPHVHKNSPEMIGQNDTVEKKTRFFPYNKDIENPPVENDYRSSYLWKEVFNPNSLLCLMFLKSVFVCLLDPNSNNFFL